MKPIHFAIIAAVVLLFTFSRLAAQPQDTDPFTAPPADPSGGTGIPNPTPSGNKLPDGWVFPNTTTLLSQLFANGQSKGYYKAGQALINFSRVRNNLNPISVDGNIGNQSKAALADLLQRLDNAGTPSAFLTIGGYFSKYGRSVIVKSGYICATGYINGEKVEVSYPA